MQLTRENDKYLNTDVFARCISTKRQISDFSHRDELMHCNKTSISDFWHFGIYCQNVNFRFLVILTSFCISSKRQFQSLLRFRTKWINYRCLAKRTE